MAQLITPEAAALRLERTLDVDLNGELLEALIDDVSALVETIVGVGVWDTEVPGAVVPVVVNMLRRALDNPHGYTSEGNMGFNYAGASGAGIFATDDERRTLKAAAGVGSVTTVPLSSYLPASPNDGWPVGFGS